VKIKVKKLEEKNLWKWMENLAGKRTGKRGENKVKQTKIKKEEK